ncbi:hypothetical protein BH11BAC2_BH11BAC2_15150 [soil metagenome]
MNTSLFVGTIIFYILSLAGSLLLAIASKKISGKRFYYFAILHIILIIAAVLFTLSNVSGLAKNYLTLAGMCSGVLLSGWAIRNEEIRILVRWYFGLYLLTVLLFLYSPSMLFYGLSGNGGNYQRDKEILVEKNYYLATQSQFVQLNTGSEQYKLIQKLGVFNKTIARDIDLGGKVDSVKVIIFTSDTIVLTGFINGIITRTTGLKPGMNKNTITTQSN